MRRFGMAEEIITLSIGGSMVNPGKPDIGFVKTIANIINASKRRFAITVGGGTYARTYVSALKALGANDFQADKVAILETRQNAMLVLSALKDAYPNVPEHIELASAAINKYKCVVMGGLYPGFTTDSTAVLLAEAVGSRRVINITNVDGVYDKEPSEKGAKKFNSMKIADFVGLAMKSDMRKAGTHFVFDSVAAKLAMRSKIRVDVVSGKNLNDVKNAIDGKPHNGTVIQ
jgi:uridylate kinase